MNWEFKLWHFLEYKIKSKFIYYGQKFINWPKGSFGRKLIGQIVIMNQPGHPLNGKQHIIIDRKDKHNNCSDTFQKNRYVQPLYEKDKIEIIIQPYFNPENLPGTYINLAEITFTGRTIALAKEKCPWCGYIIIPECGIIE